MAKYKALRPVYLEGAEHPQGSIVEVNDQELADRLVGRGTLEEANASEIPLVQDSQVASAIQENQSQASEPQSPPPSEPKAESAEAPKSEQKAPTPKVPTQEQLEKDLAFAEQESGIIKSHSNPANSSSTGQESSPEAGEQAIEIS